MNCSFNTEGPKVNVFPPTFWVLGGQARVWLGTTGAFVTQHGGWALGCRSATSLGSRTINPSSLAQSESGQGAICKWPRTDSTKMPRIFSSWSPCHFGNLKPPRDSEVGEPAPVIKNPRAVSRTVKRVRYHFCVLFKRDRRTYVRIYFALNMVGHIRDYFKPYAKGQKTGTVGHIWYGSIYVQWQQWANPQRKKTD